MSTFKIAIYHLSFVICHTKRRLLINLLKGQNVYQQQVSSNINEVIKAILNFFIQKLHNHKKTQNACKRIKIKKNAPEKHLRGK